MLIFVDFLYVVWKFSGMCGAAGGQPSPPAAASTYVSGEPESVYFLAPRGKVCDNAENARKYNEFANFVRSIYYIHFL